MTLKYIDEVNLKDQKVLARFDFNVPLNKEKGIITDPNRIDQALPTIRYILDQGALKLTLMSHLGRPKGRAQTQFSLEPVASYLAKELKEEVILTESCLDQGIKTLLDLPSPRVILLQNLRFHPEESSNDQAFAQDLANYGNLYVNDAFGTLHRKHASTYGINAFFKNRAVGGFLLKREMEALKKISHTPHTPFMALMGGAKVSDKIGMIQQLLPRLNHLLIGGAMAYPFLKAQGKKIGKSLCSQQEVELAQKILKSPHSSKIILPTDHIVSSQIEGGTTPTVQEEIDEDKMGLDIGPQSLELFSSILKRAQTIIWNGPMGIFEKDDFSRGTLEIAYLLAQLPQAFTFVGGGDSVAALKKSGCSQKINHISTGGGATLQFLEQGTLPGISALRFGLD